MKGTQNGPKRGQNWSVVLERGEDMDTEEQEEVQQATLYLYHSYILHYPHSSHGCLYTPLYPYPHRLYPRRVLSPVPPEQPATLPKYTTRLLDFELCCRWCWGRAMGVPGIRLRLCMCEYSYIYIYIHATYDYIATAGGIRIVNIVQGPPKNGRGEEELGKQSE